MPGPLRSEWCDTHGGKGRTYVPRPLEEGTVIPAGIKSYFEPSMATTEREPNPRPRNDPYYLSASSTR